jgi:hypothetical protein
MFHPEQELDSAKFMELAAEVYQLAFNPLEASNELHRFDSVQRVNTESDTDTHPTVPPTAPRRRRPRAQRPPRPRAQRLSRPSDPSSSISVPPTQLRDATTVTETTPMSSAYTTTPISIAHTTTPISAAHTTTPISAAHHEHTVSFLTQTFSPLASFSGVTLSSPTQSVSPSSPTQSVGPTLVTQSFLPISVTQSGGPASGTQLGGPAPSLPHPSGLSSATQLEDLVRDIEVGDHGMGRGRGRGTKRP